MKNLIISILIGILLGVTAKWIADADAGSITCYPNPQGTRTTCMEIGGTGWSWTTIVAPNGMSTTIPLGGQSDRNVAPKHNYDECTVATGCIPRRNQWGN